MIIDWGKLTEQLLPVRLRILQLTSLCRVLIWPITYLQNSFKLDIASASYYAKVNASTLSLEKLLSESLGTTVTLEEQDGKPYDFLVGTDSPVDENQLIALLNLYKLAGKSYTFRLGETNYSAQWVGHVCEVDEVEYAAEWVEHICEDDGIIEISVGVISTPEDKVELGATANKTVTSDITVTGVIEWYNNEDEFVSSEEVSITITQGTLSSTVIFNNTHSAFTARLISNSLVLSPTEDEYYNYIINS